MYKTKIILKSTFLRKATRNSVGECICPEGIAILKYNKVIAYLISLYSLT